jgi:hypothetical protein
MLSVGLRWNEEVWFQMSQKPPRRQSNCEMYNHDTDGQIIYICSGHKVFNNNMLNFQI